jgi:hypothetical protein
MQLTRTQYRTLTRFPRSASVWRQLNIRLSGATQVVVGQQQVRLIRGQQGQGY